MAVERIELGDESLKVFDFSELTYKAKKGHVDRIYLLNDKDVRYGKVHYVEGRGYMLCDQGSCCREFGAPTRRFATWVVQFATERDGKLRKPLSYEIRALVFNDRKWIQLKHIKQEWGLDRDLTVTLDGDETFQNLKFQPCKESVFAIGGDDGKKLRERILEELKDLEKDVSLDLFIGRKRETDETDVDDLEAGSLDDLLSSPSPSGKGDGSGKELRFEDILRDL
jgi:hypothetical protein